MFNRAIRTIFALTFAFALFFAWWTYVAHAACIENGVADTCFFLNQSERAQQEQAGAVTPSQRPTPGEQTGTLWLTEKELCRHSEDLHRQLEKWATGPDRGKKWPVNPWCEKYVR